MGLIGFIISIVIWSILLFGVRLIFQRSKSKGYLFATSLLYVSIFTVVQFVLGMLFGIFMDSDSLIIGQILAWLIGGFCAYKLGNIIYRKLQESSFKENSSQSGLSEFEYVKQITPQWIIDECEERKDNLVAMKDRLQELVKEKEISQATATALYESYCSSKPKN